MTWRGAWEAPEVYRETDAVYHEGSAWVAIRDSRESEPSPSSSDWDLLAAEGADGEQGLVWRGRWDPNATYDVNDAVQLTKGSFAGYSFIATQQNTDSPPDDDSDDWDVLAAKGQASPVDCGTGSFLREILQDGSTECASYGAGTGLRRISDSFSVDTNYFDDRFLQSSGTQTHDGTLQLNGNLAINHDESSTQSNLFFGGEGTSGPRLYHQGSLFAFSGASTLSLLDANLLADDIFADDINADTVTASRFSHVHANGNLTVNANASHNLSYIRFRDTSGTDTPRIYHRETVGGEPDNAIHFAGMEYVRIFGDLRTDTLEITGADLAEEFPFSEPVKPGQVVEIDPDNPGRLRVARDAYSSLVTGVVAGANEFSEGIVLGKGTGNEHAAPVAMSGRVYVQADAVEAIEPGDMLTTSDKAGYAQPVNDVSQAHGAVIGKAMTGLDEGETGFVLVLVNLQ